MSDVSTPSSSRPRRRRGGRRTSTTPTSAPPLPPPPPRVWLEKIKWDLTYVEMTYHCQCKNKVEMDLFKTGLCEIIVAPYSSEIEKKIPDVQVNWTGNTQVRIRCTCECGAGCVATINFTEDTLSFEANLPWWVLLMGWMDGLIMCTCIHVCIVLAFEMDQTISIVVIFEMCVIMCVFMYFF